MKKVLGPDCEPPIHAERRHTSGLTDMDIVGAFWNEEKPPVVDWVEKTAELLFGWTMQDHQPGTSTPVAPVPLYLLHFLVWTGWNVQLVASSMVLEAKA